MNVEVDDEIISQACESVRNDKDTAWCSIKYDDDGKKINVVNTGEDYSEFIQQCNPTDRVYGYVKFNTGDEMSKREKFVFIAWCGDKVPPLKKAQISTHKGLVKKAVQNFAVEVQAYAPDDLNKNSIVQQLIKAGGANYGTGGR